MIADFDGGSRCLAPCQSLAQLLGHLIDARAIRGFIELRVARLGHQPGGDLDVEVAPTCRAKLSQGLPRRGLAQDAQNLRRVALRRGVALARDRFQ